MMRMMLTWCVGLAGLPLACPSVSGQATTDGGARADAGIPAPAGERVGPELDAWWQSAVFYEVFVRSFADSTEGALAGDGIGDLRGLIERLDYLNDGDPTTETDLGITGLWLMPVCESPSYHGYDTLDYYRIEKDYGTNREFLALMDACEARGIRVIIDLVLNHLSDRHEWFIDSVAPDSAKRDWFVWRDERPEYRGPWGQRVWHRGPNGGWYYGCFYHGMPDLNYHNDDVTAQMRDVTRFWIDEMRVDGFRLDAIRHLFEDGRRQDSTPSTFEWLESYQTFCKALDPSVVTVGEVWADSDVVSRYVGSGMDIAFEFSLADAIVASVRTGMAEPLFSQLDRMGRLYPLGMYATFLRNHDQTRVMSELGGDRERAMLCATIQMCLPGVPFVYYGEEIGMQGRKPDPQLRTPMQWSDGPGVGFTSGTPWIAPKTDASEVSVAAQSGDRMSMLSRYRRLIRVRASEASLRTGALRLVESGRPDTLVFERGDGHDRLVCVFNLGGDVLEAKELPVPVAGVDLLTDRPFEVLPPLAGVVVRAPASGRDR